MVEFFKFKDSVNEYCIRQHEMYNCQNDIVFSNFTNETKIIHFEENAFYLIGINKNTQMVKSITIPEQCSIKLVKSHNNTAYISDTIGNIKIAYYTISQITEFPLGNKKITSNDEKILRIFDKNSKRKNKSNVLKNITINYIGNNIVEPNKSFILNTIKGLITIEIDNDDCFAQNWFHKTHNINLLKGSTIVDTEFVRIDDDEKSKEYDARYILKIHHTKGITTFEIRSKSKFHDEEYNECFIIIEYIKSFYGFIVYEEITNDF